MQFLQGVASTTTTQARSFPNLPDSCLTATLLTILKMEDTIAGLVVGDGVIGGKRRDGTWRIHVVEFNSGAPYYLRYQMFGDTDSWVERYGNKYQIITYDGADIMNRRWEYPENPPDAIQRFAFWDDELAVTTPKELDLDHPYEQFRFPVKEYEFVFVTSDGPTSFYERRVTKTSKSNEPLHVLDVLRVLMDIRTFRPGFIRLQRQWAFKQERRGTFKKRNWHNGDDVSAGVIYCGQD